MTDDVLDDPILDDRIRSAMHALANSHTPVAMAATTHRSTGRRLLAAAAVLLVVGGVGALVFAGQRNGEERPVSTQAPAPTPVSSVVPEPTTPDPTEPSGSPGPDTNNFRFDAPLPAGTLAVLNPTPLPLTNAFEPRTPDGDFLSGRGVLYQIIVLAPDGSPEATISVTDYEVPVDTNLFEESQSIGDLAELRWHPRRSSQFYAIDRLVTRELDIGVRTAENEPSQFDERLALAIEAADFIAGRSLDDLPTTDRFYPAPALTSAAWSSVSYAEVDGNGGTFQVLLVEAEQSIAADEFQVLATLFGEIVEQPSPNGLVVEMLQSRELQYVEQISPTQYVVINTTTETTRAQLDTLIESLSFTDAESAGITVGSPDFLGDSLARGEESWGRWEVYAPYDSPSGPRCYGFGVSIWTPSQQNASGSSSAGCPTADGEPPTIFCGAPFDEARAGVYFGEGAINFEHVSVASSSIGEPGDPIDGLGTPRAFWVDAVDGFERVSMRIDGEPIALPC